MPEAPHPYGLHRVLEPAGVLPQAARRLDAGSPLRENELAVAVRSLSVDSAAFRQMRELEDAGGAPIAGQVLGIVAERGKLQNPVTGSGGMLVGAVAAVGHRHPAHGDLVPGEAVASLVSLTLTPLRLERVVAVDRESDRVDVVGTAILFERTLWARLPADLPENVALAVFDVCGAPALVAREAGPGAAVLVIGAGKAGLLCLAAAREAAGEGGRLVAIEPSPRAAARARALAIADAVLEVDARDPVAMLAAAEEATGGRLFDLVVNVANAPGTEAASVLSAKDDGTVVFFGMATSFTAAALGAEGLAKPTRLLIGNGYSRGHAEAGLALLRRHPALRDHFVEAFG